MKVFIVTLLAASALIANVNCDGTGHAELVSASATDGSCSCGDGGSWGGDAGWAAGGGGHGGWGGDAGGDGGSGGGSGGGLGDGGAALVSASGCGGSTDLYRVYGQPIHISPEPSSIVVPASPVIVKPVVVSHGAPVSVNPTILTKSAPAQVSISPVAIKLLRQCQRPARTLVVQAPTTCSCTGGHSGGH